MKFASCLVLIFGLNVMHCQPSPKFIKASDHFYVSTTEQSFIGAWIDCKTAGMELVSVESEDEHLELNNAIDSATYSSTDGYWIGGVSQRVGSSGWYWIDTGLRIVYTNWGTYQPRYVYTDYSRQCIRLGNFYKVNQPYLWENTDCSLELYYVCKAKAS